MTTVYPVKRHATPGEPGEYTTSHAGYGDPKRNKTHIFTRVFDVDINMYTPTGITKCGKETYTTLRKSKPGDTRCKLCFRSTKPNAPETEKETSSTVISGARTVQK